MAIEIKELHIRVSVNTSADAPLSGQAGTVRASGDIAQSKDAIVAECVEQVLEVLRERKER